MPDETELHSRIGASSAYRWMACPGSVRLCATVPTRTTAYASEGTAAHALCERCLRDGSDPAEHFGEVIAADGSEFTVDEKMVAAVTVYVDKVRGDLKKFGGRLNIEKSFDLSWIFPGMFGRNDASIEPDGVFGTLRVYDYKNGKKPVFAEENSQCMYYALGALGEKNPLCVDRLDVTIIQPNCWGKEVIDAWTVSTRELYDWGRDVLLPAAKATEAPDAPLRSGDHCTFCAAIGICPKRKEEVLALLPESKERIVLPAVESLSPEQIGKLSSFFSSEAFETWRRGVQLRELELLQSGVDVPGRSLREKKTLGNRYWADEAAVLKAVKPYGVDPYVQKLKSPAQMEKELTALKVPKNEREELVAPLVARDESVKTVVVDSDGEELKEKRKKVISLF